jgi:DNA helicase-2/ATP-dependent DNA helicase PcrA
MSSLNANQQQAVETTEGRVLILAGAGSGKTKVITHRIAYLIQKKGVPAASILGLTFTNKAAGEMKHRVESLIGKELARQVTLATFHSFCMQVLRREIEALGFTKNFSLYDERDLHRVVTQISRELLGHEGELPSLGPTLSALQHASSKGITVEAEHAWKDPFAKELFGRLQSTLRAYNAVSFDHLITLTIRLFEEHPSILKKYQERYRYLMIDEYQDTNPAQFKLAELLAAKDQNLCVVGDDDQSIYGWRGAEVKNILHFKAHTVIRLEQNYRSTPFILKAANALIQHNQNRHPKQLWSALETPGFIEVFHAPTEAEEASAITARMVHFKEAHKLKWSQMALLYRSNALSRNFEVALLQASWQQEGQWVRGIPYQVFGGLEFSERSEIKDLLAYLRVIANPLDQEALLRILNVPRRGISDLLLDTLTQANRSAGRPLWELLQEVTEGKRVIEKHPKGMQGIRLFTDLISQAQLKFQKGPLFEAFLWLVEKIEYKKAIEEEVKSDAMRGFKWENVQECINTVAHYEESMRKEGKEEELSLSHFLSNTTLGGHSFDPKKHAPLQDAVQLMTLHSAKGLEFPAVFIAGLEDHILPHEKGAAQTGIEEERRLFYVGITRAQKHLTLSMARSRLKMGKAHPTQPSRFLFELPKELIQATSHKFF